MFFIHSSVYPFPESSKKHANFHTHQVNSNWAVPQTIESSAKICGSLEILHSHIPPQNSSRFFLLHTWHGTLSGVMTSGKAATAESSCLQAVGCVGCLLRASAEVLSSRISEWVSKHRLPDSAQFAPYYFYISFLSQSLPHRRLWRICPQCDRCSRRLLPKTDLCFRFYTDAFLSFSSATRGDSSMWDWAFDIEITLTNCLVYEAPRNFPGCNCALPENTVQVNNHFCSCNSFKIQKNVFRLLTDGSPNIILKIKFLF